ncbi:MAG: methylated-DNA--[protein]-cysteine S-methyltransferase [Candidatus Hodarchaeales archaeon]|jgi:methylated-DNA-[protein]-cysteine S-methyltransferase
MNKTSSIFWITHSSEVGIFHIASSSSGIVRIGLPSLDVSHFFDAIKKLGQIQEKRSTILDQACKELDEYLVGKRNKFSIPLDLQGTDFQKKVWRYLQEIPYGETQSYSQVATNLGNLKAVRAVGMANRTNPVPVVVPCHRIIGKNGKLVGYGGSKSIGGPLLGLKQQLLKLETSSKLSKFLT